jgi:HPt (histidine-containing phosphotransfer) domain-containing protein
MKQAFPLPPSADFSYIRDIAGGQDQAYCNLLRIIAKNLVEYPPQIAAASQQHDWANMRKLAHKFKSCTAYLNFPQLDEALNGLEYGLSEQPSPEAVGDLLRQVEVYAAFLYAEAQMALAQHGREEA